VSVFLALLDECFNNGWHTAAITGPDLDAGPDGFPTGRSVGGPLALIAESAILVCMKSSFGKELAARLVVVVVAVAAAGTALTAGCGGSDDKGGTSGSGGSGGGTGMMGTLTWKESGAAKTPLFASATRVKSANLDMVQITGADSAGTGTSFAVGLMTPPLVTGTYACSDSGMNGRIVTMTYVEGTASSTVPTSCTVGFSAIGDTAGTRVVGTFSGTLPLDNGTTKNVTDGKFDIVLTVNSI
jgi:hypothetical protein